VAVDVGIGALLDQGSQCGHDGFRLPLMLFMKMEVDV
jgi:hypothetical protein